MLSGGQELVSSSPGDSRAPLIVCNGLGKDYSVRLGDPIVALRDLNIEIANGEFISVVGPSGCGKSTFLRLLAGLERKTRGQMDIGGTPLAGPRKDIGVVFQAATLLAWRTVLENIMLPIDVLGASRSEYQARAMQLIRMAKLEGFEKKYPGELSGGMQQRVAICRALISQPKLLLMDEPFGALDALTRESMNVELESIWLGTRQTIILITHSIMEAVFLGTRVAVMSSRPGTIAKIFTIDLPRPRTLSVMTSVEFGNYVREVRAVLDEAT